MLYIVYITVAASHVDAWVDWMRDVHIPEVLDTECFDSATFVRDLEAETPERSFRISYRAISPEMFDRYQSEFGPALRDDHVARFGDVTSARRELLPILASF